MLTCAHPAKGVGFTDIGVSMAAEHASAPAPTRSGGRTEFFASRNFFILAAIGSAVGLGNIWRFPYVAFENGGGAFILPYLVALLVAGVPLLLLDYAIGHRYRGSAPLSFARIQRWLESVGWWQVLVCAIIAIYYAVIVAWAAVYTFFSFNKAWESNPDGAGGFFYGDFVKLAGEPSFGFEFVPSVLIPHLLVWVAVCVIILAGVKRGIARANMVFLPLLVLMFVALVVQALLLPGAADGLNALFTPDWTALATPSVWAAAVGQIFFSLSVGFGIMVTYASYLKRRSDLSGSGMVVAFANSGFEILAGVGVFAALGFMAQAQGAAVGDVATSGLGLAFEAFPTIISEAPMGEVIGVLFFGSLLFAGLTSLISIVEVVVAGVRDKLNLSRRNATFAVVVPLAVVSTLLFPTKTGVYVLDIFDEFVNKYGILAGALVAVIGVAWIARKAPALSQHISRVSSIRAGGWWLVSVLAIVPLVLTYILVNDFISKLGEPYGGYPQWMLLTFGWGMAAALVVLGIVLAALPWNKNVAITVEEANLNSEIDAAFAGDMDEDDLDHDGFADDRVKPDMSRVSASEAAKEA